MFKLRHLQQSHLVVLQPAGCLYGVKQRLRKLYGNLGFDLHCLVAHLQQANHALHLFVRRGLRW